MATLFEIRVADGDPAYARQAADEAFRRLDHLETLLSRFREHSEVCRIGRLEPEESLQVHPDTFSCLSLAMEISELTGGAFDPTLGPPVAGTPPTPTEPAPGSDGPRLLLDPATFGVKRVGPPTSLDLGAIGKGHALDCMAETLVDWQVPNSLLIAGGSSILAVGGSVGWTVGITDLYQLQLFDGSIGCSGLTVRGNHILDPRTRTPAETPARTWALSARASISDALSTAFMLLPFEDIIEVCKRRPECSGVVQPTLDSPRIHRFGKGLGVQHAFVSTEDPTEPA